MLALAAEVVKEVVPVTVAVPESVMLPVVAVTEKFLPTVEVAIVTPEAFTTVASALAPLV